MSRLLICALLAGATSCASRIRAADPVQFRGDVTDPAGDTVIDPRVPSPPDLVRATVLVTGASVSFNIRFAPGTFDSATTGASVQLDTDRDTTTGVGPAFGMGVDYVVGLGAFSGTDIVLSKANGSSCASATTACSYAPIAHWAATFHPDGIDGVIPRSSLDRFDGRLNFRVVAFVSRGRAGLHHDGSHAELPRARHRPLNERPALLPRPHRAGAPIRTRANSAEDHGTSHSHCGTPRQPPESTMSPSIRSAGVAIVAMLITSAAATKSPAPGDACSLLSKEDAAAALGEAATGPKATGPMSDGTGTSVSGCEYTGSGIHRIQLNLTRLPASSVTMYKQMCGEASKNGLAGLGDVACWYNDKHEELHVIKGTAFLSIELRRSGNPTEPITALMKKVLAKLK